MSELGPIVGAVGVGVLGILFALALARLSGPEGDGVMGRRTRLANRLLPSHWWKLLLGGLALVGLGAAMTFVAR